MINALLCALTRTYMCWCCLFCVCATASNAEPSGSTGGAGSASATTSPVRKRQADAQIDDTNAALFMVGFEHAVQEDGDEAMRKMYSLEHASNRQLVKAKIAQAIAEFGEKPGDTGSTSVQVAVLHAKITSLAEHCNSNRQDKHSRRGLEIMMEKRRKLLQYLKRKNFAKYNDVITRLKLRPVAGIR